MNLEEAERTRDLALQKVKEFEEQRERAIVRGDELEALKLSEALAKAKVKAEIEEVRCRKAQETLVKVDGNKSKANKVLNELQDLWSKYQQVAIDAWTLHKNADEKAAEIPSLHNAMVSKIVEYESLTEERISPPPLLAFLYHKMVSPSPEDLKWEPETHSQRTQRLRLAKQMERNT